MARAVFELRLQTSPSERVAQLIIDPNGEYANDNPQDAGCLRNVGRLAGAAAEDVVTYGLTKHPNDPERRITKMNFFGGDLPPTKTPPGAARDLNQPLLPLLMGKQIIDGRLEAESAGYISGFRTTDMTAPAGVVDHGDYVRYVRAVFVYRAVLAAAGFEPPRSRVSVSGLFGKDVRKAMAEDSELSGLAGLLTGDLTWDVAADFCRRLSTWFSARGGRAYDSQYQASHSGRSWSDDRLLGLLRIFENTRGVQAIRSAASAPARPQHRLHRRHRPRSCPREACHS